VSATATERTGVIVVRVWVANDASARARITATDDLSSEVQTVSTASGVEEIVATVRAWLERFVLGAARD
jgi:hypothetical protein